MKWSNFRKVFSFEPVRIRLNNITGSNVSVQVIKRLVVLSRAKFKPSKDWFSRLLAASYDEEIKAKYVPFLHQINDFERLNLQDVLDFDKWKQIQTNQIRIAIDYLFDFRKAYDEFYQVVKAEEIIFTNQNHLFVQQTNELYAAVDTLSSELKLLKSKFDTAGYLLLNGMAQTATIHFSITAPLSINRDSWRDFLSKEPSEYYTIAIVQRRFNEVYAIVKEINNLINRYHVNRNHMIITGNAGSGKTHIVAHLIDQLKKNGDYVIFFKPKQFNGDNVNFEERLLQLLQIPVGYRLPEILDRINEYADSQNKRCFVIIDALNETTKADIGFSNIWETSLQSFINQIQQLSHLYLICTLRTSYIEHIWKVKPNNLVELKGFTNDADIKSACDKYFEYYKIVPTNWNTADLTYFATPLLLDLYCQMTNEKRERKVHVSLGITSYLDLFEDYIKSLIIDVRDKLKLQQSTPIKNGFSETSKLFLNNNQAIISLDDFSGAFDTNNEIGRDYSIARNVLEGYLIFIKDVIPRRLEIVKHTQQEVGGYLIAKKMSSDFLNIAELVASKEFNEKIVGADASKHHQLRLDILKFLIALRPEIIKHLRGKESLKLSWWYLFNS